jgi:hypothetical protein
VGEAADEEHVGQVEGRKLVVASLALAGEHLDRPVANVGSGEQAAPGPFVFGQVGATRGHLPSRLDQRDGALGREAARIQFGR